MTQTNETPARGASQAGVHQIRRTATKQLSSATQTNRYSGAREAVAAADPWAISAWRTAINYLASTGRPFSADDGHALGAPLPDRPNALGGLFSQAVRAGTIQPVGYTASRRRSRHNGVQRLYVGATVR